jgi:acetolactate synthase-1/2/3 large subunit
VLVDIPKDVAKAEVDYEPIEGVRMKSYRPTYKPNLKQLHKVLALIRRAKRPVIFAGGGVINAKGAEPLTALARRLSAPVTTTLMGLGAFPGTDPLWLGMIGMHGTYRANMSVNGCDLLIAVGVRFDDRVTGKIDTFARDASIVHIDIDPTSIRKNIPVTIPVVGDCRVTLQELLKLLEKEGLEIPDERVRPWLDQIEYWKSTKPLAYTQENVIKPQYVIEKLYEITGGHAIVTTEVGQNQMWTAQYFHFDRPGRFITSGGLGTMGFGLPAAIGAQMAEPEALVIDVAGDGSIQMNIQEMATAVECCLPVKVVILNNRYLGMVRQWQELFYDRCYACTGMDHAPDFVRLAEAYGAIGLRAVRPDEVESVLREGLSAPQPVIMDFRVEPEEGVYPMVPAGASNTEMLLV